MTSKVPEFGTFHLSTDALPERERPGYWRELIGRTILRLDVAALPDRPFQSKLSVRVLPGLVIVRGSQGGLRAQRTPELLADGNDDLLLPLTAVGTPTATMSHLGREVALGDGYAMLISISEPGMVTYPVLVRYTSLSLPRKALMPLAPRLEDALMRPFPRDSEALRLLRSYVSMLNRSPAPETPELQRLVVAHVHDLVALVIGATRDAAAVAEGRGVRAARLNAIKADIAEHLGQGGELTVGAVAARQGVSPRYVQTLFESEGVTFSQFVRGQRLVRAHRMLTDPRCAGWTIAAIALESGFGDLSHFNLAFRRQYGTSPSDVRAAARREDRR